MKFETLKADMAIEWQERKLRSVSDQPSYEEKPMSTSAVSSSSVNNGLQSYFQTRNSDVQQLGQALSSGNLAKAQVAYNNITALNQGGGGPLVAGNSFHVAQRQQDFGAIGQALQAGDLAGAQQAFAALKATGQNDDPHPVSSPAGGSAGGSGPDIVLNLSNSGSTTPEQITINIANSSSGGGEQVSLSVGSPGSSNAQQVTFNLGPNSNEQIVLNLLGGSSGSGASSGATTTSGASSGSASGGISVSA